MIDLKLYYDSVRNCVFDTHGKIYPVKERAGKRWVNVNEKQVNIKKLKNRYYIQNFDDFIFLYIFGGLHCTHPCPAMQYFVNKKNKQWKSKTTLNG